jgi:hypothetical protein
MVGVVPVRGGNGHSPKMDGSLRGHIVRNYFMDALDLLAKGGGYFTDDGAVFIVDTGLPPHFDLSVSREHPFREDDFCGAVVREQDTGLTYTTLWLTGRDGGAMHDAIRARGHRLLGSVYTWRAAAPPPSSVRGVAVRDDGTVVCAVSPTLYCAVACFQANGTTFTTDHYRAYVKRSAETRAYCLVFEPRARPAEDDRLSCRRDSSSPELDLDSPLSLPLAKLHEEPCTKRPCRR